MPTYSSSQRAQINQFCNFTQAKESIAAKFLKQQDWNLERALDRRKAPANAAAPRAKKAKTESVDLPSRTPIPRAPYADDFLEDARRDGIDVNSSSELEWFACIWARVKDRENHYAARMMSAGLELLPPSPAPDPPVSWVARQIADLAGFPNVVAAATAQPAINQPAIGPPADTEPASTQSPSTSFYGTGTNASPLAASLGAIFDKYSSSTNKDLMQIEEDEDRGTARYIRDVGVSFEEPALTALHELLGSTSVGEFERDAFISGWTSASATSSKILDTISKQANHMSILRNKLASDPAFFKTTYRATFKFGTQEGQRNVAIETATDFWRQFFTASSGGIDWVTPTSPETPWLDLWLEYTTNKHKRPVNKDLWNMVGELCLKSIEPGAEKLEWWNEDGAWPMAIDEFMTWVQTQRPELGKKSGDANNATATNDEMDTS